MNALMSKPDLWLPLIGVVTALIGFLIALIKLIGNYHNKRIEKLNAKLLVAMQDIAFLRSVEEEYILFFGADHPGLKADMRKRATLNTNHVLSSKFTNSNIRRQINQINPRSVPTALNSEPCEQ